jgi:DNA-binding NarL/FixJ family response regulator
MLGILLYEDNDGLRESLVNLLALSRDFLLLGHYPRAVDVVRQVTELRPDVILMDIDMPGINGIEAVRKVRTVDKKVQILMLTIFDDNRHVLDAICAGASGYLLKKHLSDHLSEAIQLVMQGEAPMSPGIARMIVQSMQEQAAQPARATAADYGLTNREKEILGQLSKGRGLKIIAGELSISIDTVRTHIKNIYEKLQVHSQAEAVSKALNDGLV